MTKTLTLRSADIPAFHKFGIGFDNMFDELLRVNAQQSNNNYTNAHLELGILNLHLKREVP